MPLSPNFGERRGGLLPEFVVLHYTAMESCKAAMARLCDPASEVSAHYLIDYDGTVHALVPEAARAWHAGAGQWRGLDDLNSRSIGVELANDGAEPFAAPQMAALERLLAGIMGRWGIEPAAVIGHSDMAPGRKFDPGARFDWRRLARSGLSVWPDEMALARPEGHFASAKTHDAFADALRAFGYPVPPDLAAGSAIAISLLDTFRKRFRPGAGFGAGRPVEPADILIAQNLAMRFGVEHGPLNA